MVCIEYMHWNKIMNKYTVILLIIMIGLFSVYYFQNIMEGLTPATSGVASSEKCGEFTVANKNLSHTISNTTSDSTLNSITEQIKSCENLIDEINQFLPLSIYDIKIGQITQSEMGNTTPYFSIMNTPPPPPPKQEITILTPGEVQTVAPDVTPSVIPTVTVAPGVASGVAPDTAPTYVPSAYLDKTPESAGGAGTGAGGSGTAIHSKTMTPSGTPSVTPLGTPSVTPSGTPSVTPSGTPSVTPSGTPSVTPSGTVPTSTIVTPSGGVVVTPSGMAVPPDTSLLNLPSFPRIQQGATWTINANLPLGLIGSTGDRGKAGANGAQGSIGPRGERGKRGNPGQLNNGQNSLVGFNEPFSLHK